MLYQHSRSPTVNSSSSSDITNGEHLEREHLEQEHSEQEQVLNVPKTANPKIRPNIEVETMQSQLIKALFRCSFGDKRFKSRHNRNPHERED
jgi:hypothetical protein